MALITTTPNRKPQKFRGYLSHSLPTEVLNFWLEQFNPIWSLTERRGRLLGRVSEGKQTFTLRFKVNRLTQLPRPGQHVDVHTQIGGRWLIRSYSPTRVDPKDRIIEITVKTLEKGLVSTWLNNKLRTNEIVTFGLPYGHFIWPHSKEAVLLLAGGTGITPLISLLRAHINGEQPIQLHYWSKTREEACFIKELEILNRRYPNFRFKLHLTQQKAEKKNEENGRITEVFAQVYDKAQKLANTHVLACGANGFVKETNRLFAHKSKSFLSEAFSLPTFEGVGAEEHSYKATLLRQNRTITVSNKQSILDALLKSGIVHPHGCKIGICKSCVCRKVDGQVRDSVSFEFNAEAEPALRICTAYAESDIILDL
ncbi:MAG: iron-sulfur cluster-binding domain-containing protein [Neisseriaceae bacterium]